MSASRTTRAVTPKASPAPEKKKEEKKKDKTPKPRVDWLGWMRGKKDDEDEPELEFEWVGESVGEVEKTDDDGTAYTAKKYKSMTMDKKQIDLDDCIYLTPEEDNQPCEIGMVKEFFETAKGEKMISVQWLWRPEHIELPENMEENHKEVFMSETCDDNPADAIERKCTVVYLPPGEKAGKDIMKANHTFFYQKMFDPSAGTFTDAPVPADKDKKVAGKKRPLEEAPEEEEAEEAAEETPAPKRPRKSPGSTKEEVTVDTLAIKNLLEQIVTYRKETQERLDKLDSQLSQLRYDIVGGRSDLMDHIDKIEQEVTTLRAKVSPAEPQPAEPETAVAMATA